MNSDIYKTAIIGAGRIGSGFDTPDSPRVLTHAHAIAENPRLELVAIVDTDPAKEAEATKWGTRYFADFEEMFAAMKPDIIVVATPDTTHADLLVRANGLGARLVICEKPVVTSTAEQARVAAVTVPVIVNFSRRFDATMIQVCADLLAEKYGKVLSASGTYTKGIFHNGSHMIDLARYLFGEMTSAHGAFSVADFPEGEASIGGVLAFDRCPQFHLIAADARDYAIFELDILTEKRRLRFIDEGQMLVAQDVVADPLYAGFRILGEEVRTPTGLSRALEGLMDHAVAVLDGTAQAQPSLEDALKTHAACAVIVESLKSA